MGKCYQRRLRPSGSFVLEGKEREAALVDGSWHDDMMMAILGNGSFKWTHYPILDREGDARRNGGGHPRWRAELKWRELGAADIEFEEIHFAKDQHPSQHGAPGDIAAAAA